MSGIKRFVIIPIVFALALAVSANAGQNPFGDDPVAKVGVSRTETWSPPPLDIKAGQDVTGTVEVTGALNVRAGPWGDILGTLGPGAKVKITGQLGDWYKIDYNGRTAFVHSSYVKRPGEGEKPFPHSGWVNAATGLKVRRVPNGDEIGTLKDQTSVEILGVSGDYYKIRYGDNEAFVARRYIDGNQPASPQAGQVVATHFTGYVSADIGLNVRTAPWGSIVTTLPHGIAVEVTGKVDDWYRINYNGKALYVHANFIEKNRGDSTKPQPGPTNPLPAPGNQAQRISQEAKKLVGSTRFRGREVDYGNLACAQVVSTALVNAGALGGVVLNVRSIVSKLHEKGWKDVTAPPFQEGDVITWMTYDYNGDGKKDPDTHVGIMVKDGGTFKAMNNSSRLRTPRMTDPYAIGPVTRVMRKTA